MQIALDYDGTVTLDETGWLEFVDMMRQRGHHVIVVTMRHEHEPLQMIAPKTGEVPVVYTGRKAKQDFCAKMGVFFDVWIDDNPNFILLDARAA
jgi:hypothetical protein